ncbi:unnamed protein product [Sphagnum jensenii]|uniref:Uncharacterized protein n=1 Tax=Sphagnum jensenii TaxID=128206 RepID=A0ABP0WXP1_9BRYO
MLMELARREKEAGIKPDPEIDIFMKTPGLEICADTVVGNKMKRGVSGGLKKGINTVALKHWLLYVKLIKLVACFVVLSFVSIQVMLVGRAKALFMDEISSGLDSSTT